MMMVLQRLTHASMTSKQTSGQTNRMTYFLRFAFNLSKVIIFSAGRPIVRSVCLFYIFLLLSSNKMKSSFLFMTTRNNLTMHNDKYRMSDVTIIYRIVEINRAFIYLFKNFVVREYYL